MDPTVIYQPAANTGEPSAAEPPARKFANDQVVVGDIPAQRPGLLPRAALLAQLNRTTQRSPVVLTGTWGVGKTQLAAAYARARLASGWRLIAWVNARDGESLLAGLAAVAKATGLSDDGSRYGAVDAGQAVRSWLETDGSRCLLVFDDAEDPGLLLPFVPAAGAARVLITVAREPTAELGTSIPVDVFSAEEAQALLDGRTGLADEAGASAVAAELGHLPLALDQAAAMMAGQHLGYAAYLAELQGVPVEDYLVQGEDGEKQPYPPGVAEAVLLSLEAASAADPVGVCTGVMEVMAMLSPAAVRRDLLRTAGQAGTLLGRGRRVAASMVDQALERLTERSLLDFSLDGQAVSVHGLVARVVRGGLAQQGHLAAAYQATGRTAEAIPLLAQTLAGRERLLGPDHPDTMSSRNNLARAYREAGRITDAIPLVQQTLAARQRLLGPDHPSTLASRNNLASAYRATGHPAEAIPLFELTLAACKRTLGPDDPRTVATRNNLALAYKEAGRAE